MVKIDDFHSSGWYSFSRKILRAYHCASHVLVSIQNTGSFVGSLNEQSGIRLLSWTMKQWGMTKVYASILNIDLGMVLWFSTIRLWLVVSHWTLSIMILYSLLNKLFDGTNTKCVCDYFASKYEGLWDMGRLLEFIVQNVMSQSRHKTWHLQCAATIDLPRQTTMLWQ